MGGGRGGLIEIIFRHLPRKAEKNNGKRGRPVSRLQLKYEPRAVSTQLIILNYYEVA
jgi:hypothetical protein